MRGHKTDAIEQFHRRHLVFQKSVLFTLIASKFKYLKNPLKELFDEFYNEIALLGITPA